MKRWFKSLISLILIINAKLGIAQMNEISNAGLTNEITLNAMGKGGWWSIDYVKRIFKYQSLQLKTNIGYSTYHLMDFENKFNPDIIIPLGGAVQYGKKHKIIVEMGLTIQRLVVMEDIKKSIWNQDLYFGIQCRYSISKTLFLQGGLFNLKNNQQKKYLWPSFSVGYRF